MSTKRKPAPPAPVAAKQSKEWMPWSQFEHDRAFVIRDDIDADACYDCATMRMEQAEELIRGEREPTGTADCPTLDPVIVATLALLSQARAAYRAAFHRAGRP